VELSFDPLNEYVDGRDRTCGIVYIKTRTLTYITVSPHSIHCAHLLPAKIAEENNYEIVNRMYWLLHLEKWKILFVELLGPSYETTLQAIITEARERRI
jgi:hypothetical protein